ncbi:sensor histidine kinase [Alkalimarinus alittae]|uniref:histidine kinase n=1 Tax=Alkalimarinus alittae TaxID=2961619 RepID=A0ABY6N440_9ALTE|nr:PAS domain S-box protein [Alkalimarinus alittae]UZE96890.1 PAS domain S-box protein [Alkalimarinus alittae]
MFSPINVMQGLRYLKFFFSVFVLAVAVLSAVMWKFYNTQLSHQQTISQVAEEHVIQLASQLIINEIEVLRKDALYLAEKSLLKAWLDTQSPQDLKYLTDDMLAFARHHKAYDQIRFLDNQGKEVVRVHEIAGQYQSVLSTQLQDKSGRYYVTEVLALGEGEVYMSPFDLNVENRVIETPLKPMIRVGTPVFDRKGQKRGLMVVNYKGGELLKRISALHSFSESGVWLLNDSGYWLLGPAENKEWGFMYPDRQGERFGSDFNGIWNTIIKGPEQDKLLLDEGWFIYQKIVPKTFLFSGNVGSWTILSYVSPQQLNAHSAKSLNNTVIAFVALVLLLAVVSGIIAFFGVQRWQAELRIRENEARFRGLFDHAPDPIVIVDHQGVITLINNQAEKSFGYTRDELRGKKVEVLVPEKYRHQHVIDRSGYSKKTVLRAMGEGLELFAVRKDGSEFPVEISLSPVNTEQGMLVLSNIRDITTRKQTEQAIEELNRHLKKQNRELDVINKELEAFSYSVSHDLRAPLRALDGFSSTLLSDYADQLDERGQDRLNRIRAAAQRMGVLIDSLLSLSRVSRLELKHESVDLTRLAETVIEELSLGDPNRQVKLIVQPNLRVDGDPQLLRVILDNLLGNAWKFTSKRRDAVIDVSSSSEATEIVYCVKDNGVGFEMEFVDKLFGAFQRLHTASEFPGTGIGLATVQRAVHKHGGRIWADSEVGKGTAFYFTLQTEVDEWTEK